MLGCVETVGNRRIGFVTAQHELDIAGVWHDVLSRRGELRRAALAARPRLGRDRMLADYRSAIETIQRAERLAA